MYFEQFLQYTSSWFSHEDFYEDKRLIQDWSNLSVLNGGSK